MVERGELLKGPAGEMPVEAEERRKRKLLCMEDLRLALELGDSYLGQTPFIAGNIVNSRFLDTHGIGEVYDTSVTKSLTNGTLTNGANCTSDGPRHHVGGEIWNVEFNDPMVDEESGVNWQGGSVQDIGELDTALDDILNLGDL